MTNYTHVVAPYSVPQGSASASNATAHGGQGGHSTVNVYGAPAEQQAPQATTASRWAQNMWMICKSGLAVGGITVGVLLGREHVQDPDKALLDKFAAPDVHNTTLNVPPSRIINNIPRQKDNTDLLKEMKSSVDSIVMNSKAKAIAYPIDSALNKAAPIKVDTLRNQ